MTSPARRLALVALLLAAPASMAFAEVAVVRDGAGGLAAVLQMRDRDLAPPGIWSAVRIGADPATLLNPDGDLYLDGPPSIVFHPSTNLPEAVWSYWDGAHYQIAWSRFEGTGWKMVQTPLGRDFEFLTADERQNLDPRIWIDGAGNRRVVWWRAGGGTAEEVVVSVLPAGETQWWIPQRVSREGVPTRSPDIRTYPSFGTFIAAEEDYGGNLSLVIFDCPPLDGHTPQRGSDPWGRTLLRSTGPGTALSAGLGALDSSGEVVPAVLWREGELQATSLYDAEAAVWAAPTFGVWPAY